MTSLKTEQDIMHVININYSLQIESLTFLGKSDNLSYKIIATEGTYLFKIHLGNDNPAEIHSELEWLAALQADTNLSVQTPVPTVQGEWVVKHEAAERSFYCTMQQWLEGQHLVDQPLPEELQKLAKLMATLHKHAASWQIPLNFSRPSYSTAHLKETAERLSHLSFLTDEDRQNVLDASAKIQQLLDTLEKTSETWGIIHSDLHEENYITNGEHLHAIDFSCCGFGYYLFDLAEPLLHLTPENRKQFIQFYQQQHSDYTVDLKLLEAFFLWQVLRNFSFLSQNEEELEELSKTIPRVCEKFIVPFLCNQRFLVL